LALAAVTLCAAGCGRDAAPSSDDLPLPQGLVITSSSKDCPAVPEVCYRYLGVERNPESTAAEVEGVVLTGLRKDGWRVRRGQSRSYLAYSPHGKVFAKVEPGSPRGVFVGAA